MNDGFHFIQPFKEKIKNTAIWVDFNKSVIIKGFLGSLALFAPIFFTGVGVENKLFFTLLAPFIFTVFFAFKTKELFWLGGFSGVLWFYWIGLSLRYYDGLLWLFPFFIAALLLYYGALFAILGAFDKKLFWLRALVVAFIFDFLAPFGFDWMNFEILYSNSYFSASKIAFLAILFGSAILVKAKGSFKLLAIFAFAAALSFNQKELIEPKLKIELVATNINQNDKWSDEFKLQITKENLEHIDNAVKKGANLVVLPETAFPYFLNESKEVMDILKIKSLDIAILTGSLKLQNGRVYNSSYFFQNGEAHIFDKVVAVPFGEVNPMPKFLSKIVNDLFFNGADDYETAALPSDFNVSGVVFRNAICYEATNEAIYKDKPKFVMAISNNAWFLPSLEPTIQKMLMRRLSKKFDAVIFHTANKSVAFTLH